MSKKEKATLNYLLTKLRCEVEDFMLQPYLPAKNEREYEKIIEIINFLLTFSIKGDEKND